MCIGLDLRFVCFLNWAQFLCIRLSVFCVFSLACEFGGQYQCNRLSGKIRPQNDLLCVKWDVNPLKGRHVNWLHFATQV